MRSFREKLGALFISEQSFCSSSAVSGVCKLFLGIYGVLVCAILIWFAYTFVLVGDEREHLTASYYIYSGQRPYIDFFEHHHPLMWYSFLPLLSLFDNVGYIWYVMRSYMLFLIVLNCFVVYKITLLIAQNKFFSILSVFLSIASHCVFVAQITFRPDGLMSLLLLTGVYFFINYLQNKRNFMLHLAFMAFFLAFMALQKALIFLFFIALLMLFLVYKKELSFKSVVNALILPIILYLLYLFYLYKIGALKDYWELNWLLNIKANYPFTYLIATTIYYYVANGIAIVLLFTKQPKIIKYLSFLGIGFSISLFFLGTFVQYWIPLYSYFGIICAYVICRLKEKWQIFSVVLVIICTVANNLKYIHEQALFPKLQFFVAQSSKVVSLTNKGDKILGNIKILGGLRPDVAGYYWFGRDYMALIDSYYFNRHPLPDANRLLKEYKPKLISIDDWEICINHDLSNNQNCYLRKGTFDKNYVQENYVRNGLFWIRKD